MIPKSFCTGMLCHKVKPWPIIQGAVTWQKSALFHAYRGSLVETPCRQCVSYPHAFPFNIIKSKTLPCTAFNPACLGHTASVVILTCHWACNINNNTRFILWWFTTIKTIQIPQASAACPCARRRPQTVYSLYCGDVWGDHNAQDWISKFNCNASKTQLFPHPLYLH